MPTPDRNPPERTAPVAAVPDPSPPKRSPARAIGVDLVGWDRLTRAGLRALLDDRADVRVVAEAATLAELPRVVDQPADVVVLGVRSWEDDLAERVRATREVVSGGVLVVVASTPATIAELDAVLRAGASGVLTGDSTVDALAEAVRSVADGGAALSPVLARMLLVEARRRRFLRPPTSAKALVLGLSDRQRTVLWQLVAGHRPQEIAGILQLAPGTVRAHLQTIYRRLRVTSATGAIAWVHRNRVVDVLRRTETDEPPSG